ncbi:ketoacyl-ACP synthase III [Phytoactinopolyspora limicola]|uniref:ketoacyl-ACP synthase III n=1 Tax=Phytoactinopolyspora limicola TaxID=2715536 RepID=UPI00140E5A1D|nr:ketoacyl-ACP synthase III [Phytoactinopolyspora limicola]
MTVTERVGGIWTHSGLRLTGIGHYFPKHVEHNTPAATEGRFNPVDQAVIGRLGVKSRHIANEQETVDYMAVHAAHHALRSAGRAPEDIDLVIVTNWTERQWVPELGPTVASRLGASNALGFDLCGACTGFVHGVQTAAAMLIAMRSWHVAVITCSEQFSRRTRPGSKGELVAGDAAGAVVLERHDLQDAGHGAAGLIDSLLISDGESAQMIWARKPDGWITSRPEIVERAIDGNVRVVEEMLARNGLTIDDVDWVLPHPATDPIHHAVQEKVGIDQARFVVTIESRANTSSASIPVALSELLLSGRTRPGQLYLTPAIGSGFFEGALLFRL